MYFVGHPPPTTPPTTVAEVLKNSLVENGLICKPLGDTFTSDILQKNGNVATSALDHIYLSESLVEITAMEKMDASSSDHVPIFASINHHHKKAPKMKTITKPCIKTLTKSNWCLSLLNRNWEELGQTEDVEDMAEIINKLVTESLDQCAPIKSFKIRNQNKHGISENTRNLIKERDSTRKALASRSSAEKSVLLIKYKKLRNKVNSELKKDVKKFNNERVDNANNENEIWKVVNDINKPKSAAGITLLENGIKISNEKDVAEIFNVFFVEKIVKLKENIDPNYVEDPLTRLKEKLKGKNLHFKLKTVTEAKVLKTILGLKNKKSSGLDEVTQEQLKMAAEILAIPLTRIINQSISEGKFPDIWKIGVVTPVLKKGSPLDKTNYRPVTCLSVLTFGDSG